MGRFAMFEVETVGDLSTEAVKCHQSRAGTQTREPLLGALDVFDEARPAYEVRHRRIEQILGERIEHVQRIECRPIEVVRVARNEPQIVREP